MSASRFLSIRSALATSMRTTSVKNFGLIFSVMASAIALSSALGPVLGSFFYDTFGNYNGFLVIGMAGSLISGWLIFGLGKYPDWHVAEQQDENANAR